MPWESEITNTAHRATTVRTQEKIGWQAKAPAPRGTDAFVCQPVDASGGQERYGTMKPQSSRRTFLKYAALGAGILPSSLRAAVDNTEPMKITQIDAVTFRKR